MYRYIESDKVAAPVLRSARLLDQLRERIRYLHYSLQTEKAYLYWARFFIRWHGRNGAMRHPKDMGKVEVESFLTMLANERQVSPATHRQALNALLFLYKQVIGAARQLQNRRDFGALGWPQPLDVAQQQRQQLRVAQRASAAGQQLFTRAGGL